MTLELLAKTPFLNRSLCVHVCRCWWALTQRNCLRLRWSCGSFGLCELWGMRWRLWEGLWRACVQLYLLSTQVVLVPVLVLTPWVRMPQYISLNFLSQYIALHWWFQLTLFDTVIRLLRAAALTSRWHDECPWHPAGGDGPEAAGARDGQLQWYPHLEDPWLQKAETGSRGLQNPLALQPALLHGLFRLQDVCSRLSQWGWNGKRHTSLALLRGHARGIWRLATLAI